VGRCRTRTHRAARRRTRTGKGAGLLTTIALESRGVPGTRGCSPRGKPRRWPRRSGDPALIAFALNGTFMQTFQPRGWRPSGTRSVPS